MQARDEKYDSLCAQLTRVTSGGASMLSANLSSGPALCMGRQRST